MALALQRLKTTFKKLWEQSTMSCDYIWFSLVCWIWYQTILVLNHHMKPTSVTQCASVVSLLKDGYSLCQIQAKTGLGKSTVGRIGKELELDKEKAVLPSLLHVTSRLLYNKSPLASSIMLFRPPNSSTMFSLILFILKPSEMCSRNMDFMLAPSEKYLCSKRHINNDNWSGPLSMQTGLWRTLKGYYGQMRQR